MTRPDFSTRPRVRGGDGVLLAAGLLAVAGAVGLGWQARDAERAATAQLERTTRELEDLRHLEAELGARTEGPASIAVAQLLLTAEAGPGRVLAELESLMPGDVRLGSARFAYSDRLEVDLELSARVPGAYDRFLERLAASPLVEDLTLGTEQRDADVRGSVHLLWRGEAP